MPRGMALGKSSDPAVRSLAATLIDHQTASGNELLRMLHLRGMAPPMLGNDQRKTLNRLAKLQGAKFDREFLEQVGLKPSRTRCRYYEKAGASVATRCSRPGSSGRCPPCATGWPTAERVAAPDVGRRGGLVPARRGHQPCATRRCRQL